MAFTPPHTLPWRVYLYTHTHWEGPPPPGPPPPGPTLVLGELLHPGGGEDPGLRVTVKQWPRDEEALKGFDFLSSPDEMDTSPESRGTGDGTDWGKPCGGRGRGGRPLGQELGGTGLGKHDGKRINGC